MISQALQQFCANSPDLAFLRAVVRDERSQTTESETSAKFPSRSPVGFDAGHRCRGGSPHAQASVLRRRHSNDVASTAPAHRVTREALSLDPGSATRPRMTPYKYGSFQTTRSIDSERTKTCSYSTK